MTKHNACHNYSPQILEACQTTFFAGSIGRWSKKEMDLVKKARYVWSKFEDGFGQNTQNELVKTVKNITCSGRDLEILGRQSTKEEKTFF